MKRPVNSLTKYCWLCAIACLFTTALNAQMTDQVLLNDYTINPEKHGDLSFDLDATLFFKNNEFDGKFLKGYSLPAMWLQPKIVYNTLSYLQLEVGAHALIYRGASNYRNFTYNDIALG